LHYSVSKIFCSIETADVGGLVEEGSFRDGADVFIGSEGLELEGLREWSDE
jgi:hypothetical protein